MQHAYIPQEVDPLRLSWNEIRVRAAHFSQEWEGEGYEKGQTQLFYRDLFEVFGVPIRRVATFEEPVEKLGDRRGYIDLFWKGTLLVEQKSIGRDLQTAKSQALEYFPGLSDSELPKYLLLSDFQTFELYDLETGDEAKFALSELTKNVEKLGFIVGVQKREFKDQDPVNILAAEVVGELHDALEASGFGGDDLEKFLVRLVFCLFADDTGIFSPRDAFLEFLESRTSDDGSDCGALLSQLFQVLDTPIGSRSKALDEDLAQFPYVNGELFKGPLRIPAFDSQMRHHLLIACEFDWSAISPAIFGALFQSVMDPLKRRQEGAHYTTEKNIMKVLKPLFLDELHSEFEQLKARRDTRRVAALEQFQRKLATLVFFDPACGCGNFLIMAYREMRRLELAVLKEIRSDGQMSFDAHELSKIDVDQFFGIEISEFPAKIAETALWMMDHIMNNELSLEFGQTFARIPLAAKPNIIVADALEVDWETLLPASRCNFVLGNPPFIGSKLQSPHQRTQIQRIADLGGSGGTLDYVCAWLFKAADYVQRSGTKMAFVATNSITQGEQVAQLWPLLLGKHRLEISFAYRTFAWGSDARGKANVHVVIIGLEQKESVSKKRRLYSFESLSGDPGETIHASITPYLFDGSNLKNPHLAIQERNSTINCFPKMLTGSKPIDGGHYIFTSDERDEFQRLEPGATKYFRPYVGSKEFLRGATRYILHLADAQPKDLKVLPKVLERVKAVRQYRAGSKSKPTQKLAKTPMLYHINVIPVAPYLVIPEVSSERREYIPIGWVEPPVIPSNLVRVILDADKPLFGILSSAMHMSWVRHIGGRLKSDYRYSIGLIYNNFPQPNVSREVLDGLLEPVNAVLAAREIYPTSSLSDLYDPDIMPAPLRKAHDALDKAVDKLYRSKPFLSDRERAEHLFGLYEKVIASL